MKKNNIPKARKSGLVIQELNDETLIYVLDTNRAVCLNQTSSLVSQNCDGVKAVSEIGSVLADQLKSPVNEDLIWLALDQLKKENLIENRDEVAVDFNGMSRREVIRKVGLASVVALPLVSSLVAPHAIAAQSMGQSTGTCGNVCSNNNNCTNPACSVCRNNPTGTGKTCQA